MTSRGRQSKEREPDTTRQDMTDRIKGIKMNVLPRLLYLFQSLPVEIPPKQFFEWDKIISRYIWGGKRPRVRYSTLQLPREKGGMALPSLKNYYCEAQLRPILNWCTSSYIAKWKDIETHIRSSSSVTYRGE